MMSKAEIQVVPGTRLNHQGHYVPERLIPNIDLMRDDLVNKLVAQAKVKSLQIAQLKGGLFGEVNNFVALSAAEYNVPIGGVRGNLTLMSFDGLKKVTRSVQDRIAFDERLQVAKALIDSCLARWSKGADAKLLTLVQNAFNTDKEGQINTGRVLELRSYKIDDEEWITAMEAIGDALTVVGSSSYVRAYERATPDDKWEAISLDMSALTPVLGGVPIEAVASKLWLALSAFVGASSKPGLLALKAELLKLPESIDKVLSLDGVEALLDTIDVPGIGSGCQHVK
jgi:Protein of unknown function (DUF3164)